jgi:hypothetical protein
VAFVSNTQESTKSYGDVGTMSYQMMKRTKELKRDLEAALLQNNAGTAGAAASAALMASLESWLGYEGKQAATIETANGTSVQEGSAGTTPGFTTANGYPVTAPTDSTSTGSISETILKTCIAATYDHGGDPRVLLVPPRIKQKISTAFSGVATRFREVKSGDQAQIVGGADLYISDFGEHVVKPDRFMRSTVLFGIDPDYVSVAYLQPIQQKHSPNRPCGETHDLVPGDSCRGQPVCPLQDRRHRCEQVRNDAPATLPRPRRGLFSSAQMKKLKNNHPFANERLIDYDRMSGVRTYGSSSGKLGEIWAIRQEFDDVSPEVDASREIAKDNEHWKKGVKNSWAHYAHIPAASVARARDRHQ